MFPRCVHTIAEVGEGKGRTTLPEVGREKEGAYFGSGK
jgi:hypothetical protein